MQSGFVMKLHAHLLALLAVFSLTACVVGVDDEDTSEEDIIGGTVDNGDPSVVALFVHQPGQNQGSLCTASVISPTVLLTAAHCVDPREVGQGNVFEAFAGTRFDSTATRLPAVKETHFDAQFNPNNLSAGHDVGIVILSSATNLTPLPFNKKALPSTETGKTLRIVGFGTNTHDGAGAGTKRVASTKVDAFNALLLQIGNSNKQTCHGDSGGPAFQTVGGVPTIVGITSFGQDLSPTSQCVGGGFDTRVDAVAAFIGQFVK
jgi:secreted trypsin-like serine protease